jgi:hypothetical protein
LPKNSQIRRPTTAPRRLRSFLNALKNGLRAAKPDSAVVAEMRQAFEIPSAQYNDEYQLQGATENILIDMVILAAWQLYRIREMELFAPVELALPLETRSFDQSERLARYRASYDRMDRSNLKHFNRIQKERLLLAADCAADVLTHIPPGVRPRPIFDRLDEAACRPKARTATYTAQNPTTTAHKTNSSALSIHYQTPIHLTCVRPPAARDPSRRLSSAPLRVRPPVRYTSRRKVLHGYVQPLALSF